MPEQPRGCAIVVADHLATGLAVNAASVIAVTLGARVPELVGGDVTDADGVTHPRVIRTPSPVLTQPVAGIAQSVATAGAVADLFCVSFSALAQSCRSYDEYIERLGRVASADVEVIGVGLVGPTRKVTSLVGSLPLLR